jgi:thiamine pyrophosphate-dependent acetolactate synthase large subunit-like protein
MSFDEPTVPVSERPAMQWGSDALAELLSRLELPYIALNPGASYRGLHDSLVNYSGNRSPTMILCLHEEHAVAVAHGYAKVTERPLAVALHSNVGLMHGTMALFNAFCDRVPMLVIGATGPVDAAQRRPWIDWIHTSTDQGALVRSYTKWDDQPASVAAALEALVRADALTRTYPPAPTYVCLDAALQEQPLGEVPAQPDLARHRPATAPWPGGPSFDEALAALAGAGRPVILVGRVGRGEQAWADRVRLAERLGAAVLCDLKVGAGFPSSHPNHSAPPSTFLSPAAAEVIRAADTVLSLDWVDLGGTIRQAAAEGPVRARVISVTNDHVLHNGWSKDHFELPAVDIHLTAHPDELVARLLAELPSQRGTAADWPPAPPANESADGAGAGAGALTIRGLAAGMREAFQDHRTCLVRLPLGWDGADLRVAHPLDYLGQDGGAGIGSGPGMAVGAALALKGSGRLPVAVLGDGDFLMGCSALWTAAHYELPLLVIVANNRSFFNDEVHQERVARARDRPVENRWVGQRIQEPDPDLAAVARGLGLTATGPVTDASGLHWALAGAAEQAAAGATVVVDVRVTQHGYPGGPSMTRTAGSTGATG